MSRATVLAGDILDFEEAEVPSVKANLTHLVIVSAFLRWAVCVAKSASEVADSCDDFTDVMTWECCLPAGYLEVPVGTYILLTSE